MTADLHCDGLNEGNEPVVSHRSFWFPGPNVFKLRRLGVPLCRGAKPNSPWLRVIV
jgi:hypothetical protein